MIVRFLWHFSHILSLTLQDYFFIKIRAYEVVGTAKRQSQDLRQVV